MSEARIEAAVEQARRDGLGRTCFLLHFAVMIFIVSGWAVPMRGLLAFYLVLLPATVAQWQFNQNTCVLNNLELLLRSGRWRNAANPEEGAWLRTLLHSTLGLQFRSSQLNAFVYVALVVLWGLGLAHLFRG